MKLIILSGLMLFSVVAQSARIHECESQLSRHGSMSAQDAVMDYFIMGIYLNALLIEKSGAATVPPQILERAHQELSQTEFKAMMLNIDEAIYYQEPSREREFVYRGQDTNVPRPANGTMYQEGEVIELPQFLSTSPDIDLARTYAKGVLLAIRVPPGVRSINVQEFMGLPQASYERLFARNTKLKVTAVVNGQPTTIFADMLVP